MDSTRVINALVCCIFVVVTVSTNAVTGATSQTVGEFSVVCHEKSVTGYWKKDSFPASDITISLNDPGCKSHDSNTTHVWISSEFNACGTTHTSDNDTIVHENKATVLVRKEFNSVVQRVFKYMYTMQCSLQRSVHLSSSNYFNATGAFIYGGKFSATSNNTINMTMDFYQSNAFAIVSESPVSVTMNQPIYLGIKEVNNNEYFRFVLNECYATPGVSTEGIKYTMFHDKCAMDETFKIVSSTSDHVHLQMDAFTFIQLKGAVYIHCFLYVCPVGVSNAACTQACPIQGRKRRSVSDENSPDEIHLTSQQLSYSRKTTCKETSCPENSFCVDLYPAQCRCKEGYVFHWKEGTCTRSRLFYVRGVHFDDQFYDSYSDTTSVDFLRYASRIEKLFMEELKKEDKGIDGARVKFLRRGSVVVDLLLTYSDKITEREAFDNFVATFMDETSVRSTLNIKRHIKPSFDTYEEEIEEEKLVLLYKVLIPVVVVALLCIIVLAIVLWRGTAKRRMLAKENPTGITNITLELDISTSNVDNN